MSASSLGSSPARARQFSHFSIHEEPDEPAGKPAVTTTTSKNAYMPGKEATPLTTSKFANIQVPPNTPASSGAKERPRLSSSDAAMDKFLDGLSKHNIHAQDKDGNETNSGSEESFQEPAESSSGSMMLTPATDGFGADALKGVKDDNTLKRDNRCDCMQKELIDAKEQIARQQQELEQRNRTKDPVHHRVASSSVADQHHQGPRTAKVEEQTPRSMAPPGSAYSQVPMSISQSTPSDTACMGMGNPNIAAWPPSNRIGPQQGAASGVPSSYQPTSTWTHSGAGPWTNRTAGPTLPPLMMPTHQRNVSLPMSPGPIGEGHFAGNAGTHYGGGAGLRRGHAQSLRAASYYPNGRTEPYEIYSPNGGPLDTVNLSMEPNGMYQSLMMAQNSEPYQPRPIGTPLSPMAQDLRGEQAPGNPWNTAPGTLVRNQYVGPNVPTNYRRLLDPDMFCNWKYIVDKITCNNDQQASIFLQQKLRLGTAEQKFDIIEAIVAQAYPLMVNRFGNFLVQRCFDHGTPEQVLAIGNAIRGNTLSLSMDPFGCHVVQKAFDVVPDDYKAIMAHELFRRIPETVIHRYACHVWQRLFELTWNDDPPQIMKYVNSALKGMWPDVALGETGSLVVQNIFENQPEEDKRPCINEILEQIDLVAFGQFGNWCIQHICEHGAPQDRHRAIEHILHHAVRYSVDAYASKVVEKCLKINVPDFLGRYLERLCQGRADRPRIPLVDISADQYGNYLIQWILTHAGPNHRDIVVSHVRKHTVSLRGSKYGSKVAQLCCNPAYSTHPGPGVGMNLSQYRYVRYPTAARYTGAFR